MLYTHKLYVQQTNINLSSDRHVNCTYCIHSLILFLLLTRPSTKEYHPAVVSTNGNALIAVNAFEETETLFIICHYTDLLKTFVFQKQMYYFFITVIWPLWLDESVWKPAKTRDEDVNVFTKTIKTN